MEFSLLSNNSRGWHISLQENYSSLEEWLQLSEIHGLCKQIGYDCPFEAWEDDPLIIASFVNIELDPSWTKPHYIHLIPKVGTQTYCGKEITAELDCDCEIENITCPKCFDIFNDGTGVCALLKK